MKRFIAKVPTRYRIAPDWGNLRTDQILQMIENRLEDKNTWQGKKNRTGSESQKSPDD